MASDDSRNISQDAMLGILTINSTEDSAHKVKPAGNGGNAFRVLKTKRTITTVTVAAWCDNIRLQQGFQTFKKIYSFFKMC